MTETPSRPHAHLSWQALNAGIAELIAKIDGYPVLLHLSRASATRALELLKAEHGARILAGQPQPLDPFAGIPNVNDDGDFGDGPTRTKAAPDETDYNTDYYPAEGEVTPLEQQLAASLGRLAERDRALATHPAGAAHVHNKHDQLIGFIRPDPRHTYRFHAWTMDFDHPGDTKPAVELPSHSTSAKLAELRVRLYHSRWLNGPVRSAAEETRAAGYHERHHDGPTEGECAAWDRPETFAEGLDYATTRLEEVLGQYRDDRIPTALMARSKRLAAVEQALAEEHQRLTKLTMDRGGEAWSCGYRAAMQEALAVLDRLTEVAT